MTRDYIGEADEFYDERGGAFEPVSGGELRARLGKIATEANDWGSDFGGEFAKLVRPFRPQDYGNIAVQPPGSEPILELI